MGDKGQLAVIGGMVCLPRTKRHRADAILNSRVNLVLQSNLLFSKQGAAGDAERMLHLVLLAPVAYGRQSSRCHLQTTMSPGISGDTSTFGAIEGFF